jgi:peptidoglycan-associated lipoprotein
LSSPPCCPDPACGSSTGPEQTPAKVESPPAGAGVATVTAGSASGSGIAALTDPNNILSKRSVFFDFDSYVIKDEARRWSKPTPASWCRTRR